METKLSTIDICKIIRECRKCAIIKLTYSGLSLEFRDTDSSAEQNLPVVDSFSVNFGGKRTAEGTATESIATVADLEAFEDFQNMQLLIDDPAAHEALMIDRNINPYREAMNEEN